MVPAGGPRPDGWCVALPLVCPGQVYPVDLDFLSGLAWLRLPSKTWIC
jgi:hypothetical protein